MKTFVTIFLFLIFVISYGQDTTLYLHSWKKPKKVDKITNDLNITVRLYEFDSIGKVIPTEYEGHLVYIRPNEMVMTVSEETLIKVLPNGTKIEIKNSYNFPDSLKKINDGQLRTIKINYITSISHFTTKRLSDAGGTIASIFGACALIVAPLISVNYKTGNFNQKIYYPALAVCGSGIVIGATFNIAFRKNKYYKIKHSVPNSEDNDYYSIQTK